ncbi:Putrescine-binding periplasmic protein precursor [Microbulbifer aggregans]|uniref:Putrescine-binding periplasmic protein n=1 Tax=Microbulbifer aggregans TaxID=1769779 RepID=A0A1C9W3R7_9GAMM|nr:extracellular solute-binding protein [Microbulbifer aggregans]AOS95787.1 Putrescine-binding periplasmic protein precursor [Microbulbifer aggregans]
MKARNLLLCALSLVSALAGLVEARELHVANWSDYIGENTLARFEQETGIRVHYYEFDDIEELEQVWISEGRQFDIIIPGSESLAGYIKAGLLAPLDRNRLPRWSANDPRFLERLQVSDPENRYAFPFLWGTVGIGYNVAAVREAFGGRLPDDSWDLLFDPERLAKLDHCGVTLLRSPEEIFDVGLKYIGKDPNSMSRAHQLMVANLLAKVRLHVTDFDSGDYVENLASGKHCLVHGWSGDILQAQAEAREMGNDSEIRYITPREGFPIWIDVVALTAAAPNSDEAYAFMNYLMRPEVIAEVSNELQYANANLEARALVEDALLANPIIYPDTENLGNAWLAAPTDGEVVALRQRLWQRIIEREKL